MPTISINQRPGHLLPATPNTPAAPTTPPLHLDPPSQSAPWQARLTLAFGRDGDTTRLSGRSHSGPLRVQKPLYPEGAAICHAIILHPPGGVVGGDRLAIDVKLAQGAHALLCTPGAGKWYKANGRVSQQDLTLTVGPQATLEWLPQESIFFDAANVLWQQNIHLAANANYIGWEILCFGRTASGEGFASGALRQSSRIWRGGKLIWFEQGKIDGQPGGVLHNALGLRGKTVCATLLAVGKPLSAASLNLIREEVAQLLYHANAADKDGAGGTPGTAGEFGLSQTKAVLVARYLGDSSELARRIMLTVWHHVRPQLLGCAAVVPRIWNT
jgi:urease accessory protein